jgi:hypothetical protein
MAYTHFRFIAYEVLTATHGPENPRTNKRPVDSGFDAGAEPGDVPRIPIELPLIPEKEDTHRENNGIRDARTRLKRLAVAVNDSEILVRALPHPSGISALPARDDPTILKVFVVPEFFFRPPTKLGGRFHYNTYPDTLVARIFKQLNTMFRNPAFEHWLIIAGTVLWNQDVGGRSASGGLNPVIYWNTAVWIKCGPANGANGLGMVEKKLASGIDGVPQAFAPGKNDQTRSILMKWEEQKRHLFSVDGTGIGLEVCLDHADHDNYRTLKTVRSQASLSPKVGLHVLTAGGMNIQERSVAADVGGYILRNDGLALCGPRSDSGWGPERTLQSELREVLHYDVNGSQYREFPSHREACSSSAALGPRVKPEHVFTNPSAVPMGIGYDDFPEALVFYPPLPLPK